MSNNYRDVFDFHTKFDLPCPERPRTLNADEFNFRLDFLYEEVNEFAQAFLDRDLPKQADALIDLVYVAMGTAVMMGLPWQALWDEVQRANMEKKRATDASQSSRGSTLDVIKPPGWTPPAIESILKFYS